MTSESDGLCALEDFGTLRFRGADARTFLQGQLSNDLERLAPGTILRAGLHTPQGRAVALLWLAARAHDDILALLPRELAAMVAGQLRRYLLRSRLTIVDESAQHLLFGARTGPAPAAPADAWMLAADRALLIRSAGEPAPGGERMTREQWRALDIAAAQPQVYAATSGQFVAQMLNLDCIDAISFGKGCYTGQEVIARAHYRGRVKRRMQRFESLEPQRFAPGDAGRFEDGGSFRVVEAVQRPDGCCEFLAVAPLPGAGHEPSDAAGPAPAASVRARALPLPYALPD